MYKKILIILIFFITLNQLYAQDKFLSFKNFRGDMGLTSNSPTKFVQDSKGFIWITTYFGLNRFDGYNFRNFITNKNDSTSIGNNHPWDICQISDLEIAIATEEGVYIYNYVQDGFNILTSKTPNKKFKFKFDSRSIIKYSEDTFLIATVKHGIWQYIRSQKKITEFNIGVNLKDIFIQHLLFDSKKRLWISTLKNGIYVYNTISKKTGRFYENAANTDERIYNGTLLSYEDSKHNIWIATEKGLYKLKANSTKISKISFTKTNEGETPKGVIRAIIEDSENNLWIGFINGLVKFNPENENYSLIQKNGTEHSLINNEVLALMIDSDQNFWIGCYNSGISFLSNESRYFKSLRSIRGDSNSLSINSILGFHQDENDNLWIATDHGGIDFYNFKNKTFKHYRHDENNPKSLSSDAILSIEEAEKGKLWVGTWGGGLNLFDTKTGNCKHFIPSNNPNSISGWNVWKALQTSKYEVWIGTHQQGANRLNLSTGKLEKYFMNNSDSTSLPSNIVRDIVKDHNGNIWFATDNGVCKYLPISNNFKRFLHGINGYTQVMDIYADSSYIWVATSSSGVYKINLKTEKVEMLNPYLQNFNVSSIIVDNNSKLWMGTGGDGLIWYDSQKDSVIKIFDRTEGLQDNYFNPRAIFNLKNGDIAAGGIGGLSLFSPSKITLNKKAPPIYFTDFQVFNKSVAIGSFNLNKNILIEDTIILKYKQSVFSLNFTALDYSNPSKNLYAYKLIGFDKDWHFSKNVRSATYTNLDPGEYVFWLRASNSNGIWNTSGKKLKIIILPPWYMTWWARTIFIFLFLSVFLFIYFYRVTQLKKQHELLEQKVNERTADLNEANVILEERQEEIIQQNAELNRAYKTVELQNSNIKSSINYAQTIQNAMLPNFKELKNKFDFFVLYHPKDIVSGDFYWTQSIKIANIEYIFIAVVDCTGHGVPGAFMSMIGIQLLNQIVVERNILKPNKILKKLNDLVIKQLKQGSSNNNDGMDIGLLRYQFENNILKEVVYSAAKRPLYLFKKSIKDLTVIKGDRRSIGGSVFFNKEFDFNNTVVNCEKGDILYLSSDGYIDQNNSERKRYGSANLINNLKKIALKSMSEQKDFLEKELKDWMKNEKQRDDISFLGIKLKD